jgi:hypothetical protein
MKKILVILIIILLSGTMTYAANIIDKSGTNHSASGYIKATVIIPLSLQGPSTQTIDFGVYAISNTPYDVATGANGSNILTWTISGQVNASYTLSITSNLKGTYSTLQAIWSLNGTKSLITSEGVKTDNAETFGTTDNSSVVTTSKSQDLVTLTVNTITATGDNNGNSGNDTYSETVTVAYTTY